MEQVSSSIMATEAPVDDTKADAAMEVATNASDLMSLASSDLDEETKWALGSIEEGAQNNPEFAEMAKKSFEPLKEQPGVVGQLRTIVTSQMSVLDNVDRFAQKHREVMEKMDAHNSEKGKVCLQDHVDLRKKLTKFVRDVMRATSRLDTVLSELTQGLDALMHLKEEAAKGAPDTNMVKHHRQEAIAFFAQAQAALESNKKLDKVQEKGRALAKDAQAAGARLEEFADEWKLKQDEKMKVHQMHVAQVLADLERKEQEVERARQEKRVAKDAASWSIWGIGALVALAVVGVGVAAVATGGAALAPLAVVAAHSAIWGGGVVATGCLFGAGMAWRNHDQRIAGKKAAEEAYNKAKFEYEESQKEHLAQQVALDAYKAEVATTMNDIKVMMDNYTNLRANVLKCMSQSEVLLALLQPLCNLSKESLKKVSVKGIDEKEELDLLCRHVTKIRESFLKRLQTNIEDTREANDKLRNLAIKCFTMYVGLDSDEPNAEELAFLEVEDSDDEDSKAVAPMLQPWADLAAMKILPEAPVLEPEAPTDVPPRRCRMMCRLLCLRA